MSTSNLSPEAAKGLLALQKELRQFLKQFEKLEKGGAERSKHIANAKSVKDLYVTLSLADLKEIASLAAPDTVEVVEEVAVEVPKTKKEARKARREARKAARKNKKGSAEERRAVRRGETNSDSEVVRKEQKKDKSGAKEESQFRYDSLMKLWGENEFDQITTEFRTYLDKGEQFLVDAQNFIDYAQSFAPGIYIKEIEEAEDLIGKVQKFLAIARNVDRQVMRYKGVVQDVVDITMSLPTKLKDLKGGIVAEATKIFAAAKSFIATADTTDDEINLKVEKLQDYLARGEAKLGNLEGKVGDLEAKLEIKLDELDDLVDAVIGDVDGNNLPDWYDRLELKFGKLLDVKKDLIPGTDIDNEILIQIIGFKNSVEEFIANASDKVEALELQSKIDSARKWLKQLDTFTEVIQVFLLGVENGVDLQKWYAKLSEKFEKLLDSKTDLIPGTKIDDNILIQITGLKKSVDRFVEIVSGKVDALGFQEKLQNAQQWLGKLGEFTEAITGFVENIKDGDFADVYQDLKDFENFINSDKDILEGTTVDDKIKAKLQEYSGKARSWLMHKLTKGDPDKTDDVRSILGAIDKIILSTGGVVDHSSKYEKDENRITVPEINAVSQKEIKEVLEKYGIRKKDSSYEGILSDMKDQADVAKDSVGVKFKDAATRGSQASAAFRDAKEEYDQSVTKHNDYFRATNTLGKRIISGLLSIAGVGVDSFLPGAGSVIGAVGSALLGDFDEVNDQIDKVMPEGLDFVGDLAKEILPGVLPKWGNERGIIQIEGKELLAGLNELYMNGISARYQDVISLLNGIKAKSSSLGKNLRSLEQADTVDEEKLAEIKKNVIILELKWSGLKKDISKKYINLPYPPINEKKAYRNASRYLYSVWLIRFPQKEIRISDSMIKQFEKFGIMSESKAEWDTGFWSGLGRGFFGFFGGDPFDYRGELKKMKTWASSENDTLKSAQAWAEVF